MSLETLRESWSACRTCPLRATCRGVIFGEPYTRGDVGVAPLVLVVLEPPGRGEDEAGLPMVGPAGEVLREVLDAADLRLAFVTNAVGCRPPGNREPTAKEFEACSPRVAQIAAEILPAGVVFVGTSSALSSAGWARGLPSVQLASPSILVNQGHPTAKTGRAITAQAAKVRRLLSKLDKLGTAAAPIVETERHVCSFKEVGSWVGPTGVRSMALCKCGVLK